MEGIKFGLQIAGVFMAGLFIMFAVYLKLHVTAAKKQKK